MNTPELDYITVKGFKSIASVEKLALGPINVIIGPNGSGKSNFIEVFALLRAIREGRLDEYVRRAGGAEQLLHFGSKVTADIELLVSFPGDDRYGIILHPAADDDLFASVDWSNGRQGGGAEAGRRAHDGVRGRLDTWRVYHVHDTSAASPLRKTAKLNDNAFLRPDGSNLPAFLFLLQHKHPTSYSLIRRTIQRVAPFFDDFQLRPDPLNEEAIRLEWKHKNAEKYFGASSLSDGTLRFIALATLLLQPEALRPSLLLVDEPELGLHPSAITLLASLVKQASVKTQVILSTQSALLLDHFQPEDVLVADLVGGATQFSRLDSERLAAWLEDYSLGQLWEKNELGGRPGGP